MTQQNYPNIQEFSEDFEQEHSVLGEGTFAKVYKMKTKRPIDNEASGKYYAVKFMQASTLKSFEEIQKEFKILRVIPRHQNIVSLKKTYAWQKALPIVSYNLCLVMELADRSLAQEIDMRRQNQNYISEIDLLYIFKQCFETFDFLIYGQKIYHRDIKPQNIMFAKKDCLDIKITDFGVSRRLMEEKLSQMKGTLVGTPVYLSPLLWVALENGEFDLEKVGKIKHDFEKSDIYSLGITLLQCTLLLKNEVVGLNQGEIGQKKTDKLMLQIPSEKIRQILRRMLEHNEESRASYKELLNFFFPKPTTQSFSQRAQTPNREDKNLSPVQRRSSDKRPIFEKVPSKQEEEEVGNEQRQFLPPRSLKNELTASLRKEWNSSVQNSQQKTKFCSKHPDQIVKFYCYADNINNYSCDSCKKQFNSTQIKQLITLPELKGRIKEPNFNIKLKEKLGETKRKTLEIHHKLESQYKKEIHKLSNKIKDMIDAIYESEIRKMGQSLSKINKLTKKYFDSIEKLWKENEDQIIELSSGHQFSSLDLDEIQKTIKNQNRLEAENSDLNSKLESMKERNEKLVIDMKKDFLNKVNASLQDEINQLKFQCVTPHKQMINLDLQDQILTSKYWEIEDGQLILDSKKRKTYLTYARKINLNYQCLCLGINNLNQVYYQTEDLGLYVKQLDNESQPTFILKYNEIINCFSFLDDKFQFVNHQFDRMYMGTQSGIILQYEYLKNDEKIIFSKDIAVTSIASQKSLVVCGMENGAVYSIDIDNNIRQIQSIRQQKISGILIFDNWKLIMTISATPYISIHSNEGCYDFDTQHQQILQIIKCQDVTIMTTDNLCVKLWNLTAIDGQKNGTGVGISLVEQIDLVQQFSRIIFTNNFLFGISCKVIKGFEYPQTQYDFLLDHKALLEWSTLSYDQNVIINADWNNKNYISYSIGKRILIWQIDVRNK